MGRKTRLTPVLQEQICAYVNAGAPLPDACEAAGVSWNTAKDWMKRGKGDSAREPYASFVAAVRRARAKWTAAATMRVTKASGRDWRAAAWLLERRCKAFRPPTRHEHTGKDGKAIEVDVTAFEGMSRAELEERARKLMGGT